MYLCFEQKDFAGIGAIAAEFHGRVAFPVKD